MLELRSPCASLLLYSSSGHACSKAAPAELAARQGCHPVGYLLCEAISGNRSHGCSMSTGVCSAGSIETVVARTAGLGGTAARVRTAAGDTTALQPPAAAAAGDSTGGAAPNALTGPSTVSEAASRPAALVTAGQPAAGAAEGSELTESRKKRKAEADCCPSLLPPSAAPGGVGKRRASPEAEVSLVLHPSFALSGPNRGPPVISCICVRVS